ncbi:unnamed protein product [Lactuca saligna]|uniref:Uncharacterized protein n=1 Tax=Lactuca saligna TaxID=75948 RepID=A0AA35ZUZ5_LACSI|nr:unnamed protein product [Lactuca saligna]
MTASHHPPNPYPSPPITSTTTHVFWQHRHPPIQFTHIIDFISGTRRNGVRWEHTNAKKNNGVTGFWWLYNWRFLEALGLQVSSIFTVAGNHLGCGDLVRHVEDMVDNLLTHVQILALLSPCGHGGPPAVTPGHEAKPHVCSGGLVGTRKLARKPSLGKFPFQKNDPDRDRGVDWHIIPLSPAYALISLAMVMVRAPVLKLAGDGLLTSDSPARVPSWTLIIERSLNLGRNECWLAKEAGRLGHVAHLIGISSVPRGTLSSLPSLICSDKGVLSCNRWD